VIVINVYETRDVRNWDTDRVEAGIESLSEHPVTRLYSKSFSLRISAVLYVRNSSRALKQIRHSMCGLQAVHVCHVIK